MLQAYQGYFENGRFISSEAATIPDKVRVIVTLIGDELTPPPKTKGLRQIEALDKFLAAIDGIKDEPISDTAFSELENSRPNFGRDLEL